MPMTLASSAASSDGVEEARADFVGERDEVHQLRVFSEREIVVVMAHHGLAQEFASEF